MDSQKRLKTVFRIEYDASLIKMLLVIENGVNNPMAWVCLKDGLLLSIEKSLVTLGGLYMGAKGFTSIFIIKVHHPPNADI